MAGLPSAITWAPLHLALPQLLPPGPPLPRRSLALLPIAWSGTWLRQTTLARRLHQHIASHLPSSTHGIRLSEVNILESSSIPADYISTLYSHRITENCAGLWVDEAYCVKAPTTAITTHSTAVTTSTRATMTPPAPTQAGIPSECNAYDVAQHGDGCEVFASRNNITVDQLCE